ncbi:MAG TPA: 2'-5' RNA ligase family protein [Flavobacteriales bacterium]|nr:2'-5' RNA ligase family protein [Flavobacteriales bacterium]HRE97002.1 2'-5' RNA ligase family protein [Flavobacteriales bacterium]HRJ34870.1 2'-5' RNA ligase family protein [Flavobacteriales bacterium]HRJ39142.1 2'-5' RNA ligase family protein [Flavobacteriales bacterium]
MKPQLFFTAFLFQDDVSAEIQSLKQELAERTNARHTLKILPHITLLPPATFTEEEIIIKKQLLEEWSRQIHVFEIKLKGFGHFRKDVVFIQPEIPQEIYSHQQELVKKMQSAFPGKFPEYSHPWHPHATLAFRDLNEESFQIAIEFLRGKKIQIQTTVHSFAELKHQTIWVTETLFPLPAEKP